MTPTAATSLAAFHDIDHEKRRQTNAYCVLEALHVRARTAGELARDLDWLGEHEATRRCGDLRSSGLIERGERRKNPSGALAYVLTPTEAGRAVLRGHQPPPPPVKRRDLEKAVLLAARMLANTDPGDRTRPSLMTGLKTAQAALDAHDAGRPQHSVPAPYGDPRRRSLAEQGVWLRTNGKTIPIHQMNDHHLDGALSWLRRHGAGDQDPTMRALLHEAHGRQRGS